MVKTCAFLERYSELILTHIPDSSIVEYELGRWYGRGQSRVHGMGRDYEASK